MSMLIAFFLLKNWFIRLIIYLKKKLYFMFVGKIIFTGELVVLDVGH